MSDTLFGVLHLENPNLIRLCSIFGTGFVIYTKGHLWLDKYDSKQNRREQCTGCILERILVWLMDPI